MDQTVTPPDAKSPAGDENAPERVEAFVRLLAQNQRRIFLYVMTLVPNLTEAEEIIQETNLVLWREFGQFQQGTNFAAWSCKVAFHQVLNWRKRKQRDRLEFSQPFLEAVAREAAENADRLEDRTEALAGCLAKLPVPQRDLVRLRYRDGLDIETVAQQVGRTVEAVYRALSRIRHALHECVSRTLAREART